MDTQSLMITGFATLLVTLIFIAYGQLRINSRVDSLRDSNTKNNVRVDHIEKDVHDIKEEQRVISEGYARQYQDIAVMIDKAIDRAIKPLSNKIEKLDDHMRESGK